MNTSKLISTVEKFPWAAGVSRWVADQYAEGSVVEIKQGVAAGLKWRRHHRYVHGYWLGHYEMALQEALAREILPGQTVFDIGANAGFFSLIAARLVGKTGRCVFFEPAPENCESIREQMEMNQICAYRVVGEAISDTVGSAYFSSERKGSPCAHLGPARNGELQASVKVTTVDGACTRFGRPDFIKMDIEGGENAALRGATMTLRKLRPVWMIELHDADAGREVVSLLEATQYDLFDLDGLPLDPVGARPRQLLARPRPGRLP